MAANATEPMNKELRTATRRENQRSQAYHDERLVMSILISAGRYLCYYGKPAKTLVNSQIR